MEQQYRTMERWNRAMERWNSGTVEQWNSGTVGQSQQISGQGVGLVIGVFGPIYLRYDRVSPNIRVFLGLTGGISWLNKLDYLCFVRYVGSQRIPI